MSVLENAAPNLFSVDRGPFTSPHKLSVQRSSEIFVDGVEIAMQ